MGWYKPVSTKALNTAFADFVRKEHQASQRNSQNAGAIKERFQGYLDVLFGQVNEWLKDYIENGTVKVDFQNVELHETPIGSYQVKKAIFYIGSKKMEMLPVGAAIIGALGRVDLIGEIGAAKLLVVPKDAQKPTVISLEHKQTQYFLEKW